MIAPATALPYSVQFGLLVAVMWVVARAFVARAPLVRVGLWRGVLVAALALPLSTLLPTSAPSTTGPLADPRLPPPFVAAAGAAAHAMPAGVDWPFWLTLVLCAGAALQLARLQIAWTLLQRVLAGSAPARHALFEQVAADLRVRARLVWHPGLPHPCTFGHGPAIVVMPADLASASSSTLRAIFTHELLHVARRDWRWLMFEEAIAVVLWFHPAAWLTMRELRLAREEVIDRATVALTGARRVYLETLVDLADRHDGGPALSLSFFRARQLRRRVKALTTEASMSRTQLVCVSVVVVTAGVMTVATAQRAFPMPAVVWLQADSQAQPAGEPGPLEKIATIAPRDAATPSRIHYVAPAFDASAAGFGAFEIDLTLVIDARGRVVEARWLALKGDALSSNTALPAGAAVVKAARQWRFAPPSVAPLVMTTSLRFEPSTTAGAVRFSSRERPIPIEIKSAIYPDDARRAGVEGVVQAEITVDRSGRVESTRVLSSPMPSMADAAVAALRASTFHPGLVDGQRAPVKVTMAVRFALK